MSHPIKNITLFGAGKNSRSGVRCQAKSKQTRLQCGRAALPGKRKCRFHGGLSTGPRTEAGRAKCAHAKLVHGRETRARRQARREGSIRLRHLEDLMHAYRFTTAKRTPGRKPGGRLKATRLRKSKKSRQATNQIVSTEAIQLQHR